MESNEDSSIIVFTRVIECDNPAVSMLSPCYHLLSDNLLDTLLQQLRSSAVPLEVLRDDLGVYLKVLRSAMIELINRDYADFVNLSSNLVGLDKKIENLQDPLLTIRDEVMNVKNTLDDSYNQLSVALGQRREVREKKNVLESLMKMPNSLEHIEKLLQGLASSSETTGEDALRGNVMERAANEYNHLQHYITKAGDSPLVQQLQKRIEEAERQLMMRLEDSLLRSMDLKDELTLKNTLRTYALLDKCSTAENLILTRIVRPNMESMLSENLLKMEPRDLSGILGNVKKFIRHNLKEIIDATTGADGIQGFNFVANSIWPSFSENILQMTAIFAPGNPDLLQKRYLATMEFIEYLEILSGSVPTAQAIRNQPSYQNLMNRWNLPVYFQIRFQDIAGNLESALGKLFDQTRNDEAQFKLEISQALWKSLNDSYDPDIYLPALGHRFWKLSLQLIAQQYVLSTTQLVDMENQPSVGGSLSHAASMPRLPNTDNPTALTNYVFLYTDVCQLLDKLPNLWSVIKEGLEQMGLENTNQYYEIYSKSIDKLRPLLPKISELITADLKSQCCVHLRNVTDIPRLFRRTNREAPTKSCQYVNQLLAPLDHFRTNHQPIVEELVLQQWMRAIVTAMSKQYLHAVSDVLTSVQKTEESLKRLRKARGGPEATSGGISDDDKIRMQLALDVEAFLQQIESFVDKNSIEECRQLLEIVGNAKR
nr:EOG090X03KZ [Eulimnadia texana]